MSSLHKPISLTCEYFKNPLAIDVSKPRLSWIMRDDRRGAKQSAYQVQAASTVDGLLSGKADLWDSGKASSNQSVHVEYAGKPLASRAKCYWRVRIWDAKGVESDWSETAFWEMGLLDRADWKAKWIGSSIVGGPYSIPPTPYLRKAFDVSKSIQSARLYVTALGAYAMEINGKSASPFILPPGRTEYKKRVPYHVLDVTALLQNGKNVVGAILGDGWYCGHLHSDPRQTFGDRPRLLAQLEITFADGSTQTIVSDESWKTGEGPIRSSDMLMGEDYDARAEIPGWSAPGFDDAQWQNALVFDDPGIAIVAHRSPPIKKIQEIKPIAEPTVSKNRRRWLFDMGQNMVGYCKLRFRNAPAGKVIDLRHTEMLDKDGKPYTTALRTARAIDHYTTKGGAEEIFEPHFTFHGFRYVEVRDYPGTPTADDLTGVVIHSDTEPTGEFECSDPMINQLQSNILWSQKGNFLDIPTDCPQRDERLGWTGDAQVFIRTAAFNMNVAGFFTKWIQDVADSQYPDGHIPSVVPHVTSIHHEGGPAWADAAVICPWNLYLCYGDTRILSDHYEMMAKFVQYLIDTCPNYIRADETKKWRGYGDWLSMDAYTPPDVIGTAFFAHCADLMSRIAGILGKSADQSKYTALFENVRKAFNQRYITPDGLVIGQTQTAYVLALHFNLLSSELRPKVFEALLRDIKNKGDHLSTGFVGTPYLPHVLTDNGRPDVAYTLLHQKTFPGWLFPITHGATTMWERWDGWTPEKGFNDAGMNSYNHYAYGAVGAWMYAAVAGIDIDEKQSGYKHIIFRPHPSPTLTYARAKLHSVHGTIESSWQTEGNTLKLELTVPANTTATLRMPTSDTSSITESGKPVAQAEGVEYRGQEGSVAVFALGAGKYGFVSRLKD